MKRQIVSALALALLLTGCQSPPPEETQAAESLSPVYADWSHLTPYEPPQAKYTRRYPDFTDTLIPAEDYGPLVPFPGAALTRHAYGFDDTYTLYGLATLEGEVVVDPVFTSAQELTRWDTYGQEVFDPQVLLLTKSVTGPDGELEARSALCARDGSWCTDFLYTYDWELFYGWDMSQGIPLVEGATQLTLLSPTDGTQLWAIDIQPFLDMGLAYPWQLMSNIRLDSDHAFFPITGADGGERYYIAHLDTGEAVPAPGDVTYVGAFVEGLALAMTPSGWGCLDGEGRWVVDPVYQNLEVRGGGIVLVQTYDGLYRFLDDQGAFRLELPRGYDSVYQQWGFWKCSGEGLPPLLFDPHLAPVPLPEGVEDVSILGGGYLAWTEPDGSTVLWREGKTRSIPQELGQVQDFTGEYALMEPSHEDDKYLFHLETGERVLLPDCHMATFQTDPITGQLYIWSSSNTLEQWRLFDLNGNVVSGQSYDQGYGQDELIGGLLFQTRPDRATLSTLDGEVVFQWLIPQASD